jgi:hypothetical protein
MAAATSNVQLLSTTFKLDLPRFISTDLNASNFAQYSPLVLEIIQTLISLDSNQLQSSTDKVVTLCLPELFAQTHQPLLLNHIRQSSPHCSPQTFTQLFTTFIVQFTILATSKGTQSNTISPSPSTRN